MGFRVVGSRSVQQLQRHIRTQAQDTSLVILTVHAKAQMKARRVLRSEVFECLRCGSIHRTPEPNPTKGSLEIRVEYYVAGRTVKTVVALCDEDPSLLVVTVIG